VRPVHCPDHKPAGSCSPLALAQFIASYAATNMNVAISDIAKDLDTNVAGLAIWKRPRRPWNRAGTILLEKVAFRGVLWGLVNSDHGAARATLVSSVLFGLWHVLSSSGLNQTNPAVADLVGTGEAGQVMAVSGAVLFTGLAGVPLGRGSVSHAWVTAWATGPGDVDTPGLASSQACRP
jgi:hypothetical protein